MTPTRSCHAPNTRLSHDTDPLDTVTCIPLMPMLFPGEPAASDSRTVKAHGGDGATEHSRPVFARMIYSPTGGGGRLPTE